MKLFIRELVHALYVFSPIILLSLALGLANAGNREGNQDRDQPPYQTGHVERADASKKAEYITAFLPLQQANQKHRAGIHGAR